jgi:beta-glucosidase
LSYGLSYSKFEYSDLKLSDAFQNGKIVVSVKVKNTGKVTGKK